MESQASERTSEVDQIDLRPSKKPVTSKKEPTKGPRSDDEFYDMFHDNRGIALIFNHKNFIKPLYKTREGTEFDRDAMKKVLTNLGFHVEVYEDYRKNEIMEALNVVSKMDHSHNDCLVVVVLTHGTCYGRLCAKDVEYTTDELVDFFSGQNCPSLAAKPKLFFLQACRGERTDPGVKIQSDSGPQAGPEVIYTIPSMADILIMHATVDGYYAWRDTKRGGCFIQSLAKQLQAFHKDKDLLSILTMVNREVALTFESRSIYPDLNKKKAMCSFVSMLTRTLRF